jgi:peroxiredoxin
MAELHELGVRHVFGLSTQDTPYQREAKDRLHLPYELLSDEYLQFAKALKLPTFDWHDKTLVKRCALAIKDGIIVNVWYPVFPPDANAREVVAWLKSGK